MKLLVAILALLPMLSALSAEQPNCEAIQNKCGEAGFTRDLPQGRDLTTKCFQPIMNGQKVDGVSVDPAMVKKCSDEQKNPMKAAKHKKHSPE